MAEEKKFIDTLELVHKALKILVSRRGSDLFLTVGAPASIKLNDSIVRISSVNLSADDTYRISQKVIPERLKEEFRQSNECNFALDYPEIGRFRVNLFVQQSHVGLVFRVIENVIPTIEALMLPEQIKQFALQKRGLVIVTGPTGSGKSATLASMVGHRNEYSAGHILTIEDPIEYVHSHKKSLISQREVGNDTHSWLAALKNGLRQAPDVVLLGEIRDTEVMHYAITLAETGHLCMTTLHTKNAALAIERVANMFAKEQRFQVLEDIKNNLNCVICQRLIPRKDQVGRIVANEILINTPRIADLIGQGSFSEISEAIKASSEIGMMTFDQSIYQLYANGMIDYDHAIANVDSENNFRLQVKLNKLHLPSASSGTSNYLDTTIEPLK